VQNAMSIQSSSDVTSINTQGNFPALLTLNLRDSEQTMKPCDILTRTDAEKFLGGFSGGSSEWIDPALGRTCSYTYDHGDKTGSDFSEIKIATAQFSNVDDAQSTMNRLEQLLPVYYPGSTVYPMLGISDNAILHSSKHPISGRPQEFIYFLRKDISSIIMVTLYGDGTQENDLLEVVKLVQSRLRSPEAAIQGSISSVNTSHSSSIGVDENTARLKELSRDDGNNYFIILASSRDKEAMKMKALELGGWVLETSLTELLAPNLYAVVYGPFKDSESAKQRSYRAYTGKVPSTSYVKNAGKLQLPVGLPFNGSILPVGVSQALAAEIDLSFVSAKIPFVQLQRDDGTLCHNLSNSFGVSISLNQPYKRRVIDAKTAEVRGISSSDAMETLNEITLWVIADTGEVLFPVLCFD